MRTHETGGWPTGRGRRPSIALQFGQTQAEVLQWALTTGDPLADAVVAETHERGREVREALAEGLEHGLAALDDAPPAVAALLEQVESVPDYVDDELLDTGSLSFFTVPTAAHVISLSAGALVRVYQSPSIAKVLASTGRLIDDAPRRIQEMGRWVNAAMVPGWLRRGRPGYVATVQVRLLHAHTRHQMRAAGFDEAAYGTPINQVDLARTWMDSTLTLLRAEEMMGFGRTASELASLYRYWWYVGHLLGVDARLIEGLGSNEQAGRVDAMLQAVTGPPAPETRALTRAGLDAASTALASVIPLPQDMWRPALDALTRRLHGNAVADEMGLAAGGAVEGLLDAAIAAVRARRAGLRADPEAWRRERDAQIALARATARGAAEPTAYQRQTAPA